MSLPQNEYSQIIQNKSLKSISFEVVKSIPWFLQDQNLNFVYHQKPLPSGGRISLNNRGHYFGVGFDVVHYHIAAATFDKGDVAGRYCRTATFIYGRNYSVNKIQLNITPFASMSFRYGEESIFMDPGWGGHHGINGFYLSYNSPGVGLGFNINKSISRFFYVGIESQYSHYFEKKEPFGDRGTWPEFISDYKVKKDVIFCFLKLGFYISKINKPLTSSP